jgi:RNA 2'-O ribose methyltransferase substrate binding
VAGRASAACSHRRRTREPRARRWNASAMAPPPAFAAGWPAARPLLHAAARAPQRLWPLPAAARCCATAASDAVRSLQNPRVKAARALLRRRGRERGAQLLVEGHRLVLDAAAAGHAPEALFYTEDALARGEYGQRLRALVRARSDGESAVLVTTEVMAAISDTVTPQGCVAILAQPDIPLPSTSSLVRGT